MLQNTVHYTLHFLFPGIIAFIFFRKDWKKAWLIMLLSMMVDLDHLLATPVFNPNRCSIGFHPFHSFPAILIYLLLMFFPKSRIIATGLLFHIITDSVDCVWMNFN